MNKKDEEFIKRAKVIQKRNECMNRLLPDVKEISVGIERELNNLRVLIETGDEKYLADVRKKYKMIVNLDNDIKAFVDVAQKDLDEYEKFADEFLAYKAEPDPKLKDPEMVSLSVKLTPGINERLTAYAKKNKMSKADVFLAALTAAAKAGPAKRPKCKDKGARSESVTFKISQERKDVFGIYCGRVGCDAAEGANAILDGYLKK